MKFLKRIAIVSIALCCALTTTSASAVSGGNGGLTPVSTGEWGETHVRKVLHAFALGGFASDTQIAAWAAMEPAQAVAEMLTFDYVNDKLSPNTEDASASHCQSLEELQDFWGSAADPANPMPYKHRSKYATLSSGTIPRLSTGNLQRTLVQAINTRGCNPFLYFVAFYITHDHAAISVDNTGAALIRNYFDDVLAELNASGNIVDVLAAAAKSAAFSKAYGHQYNHFLNDKESFEGNDDFAREFHQLLFRILGTTEDPDYHENTTIEHTSWLLTGMDIDKVQNAYGSASSGDWYVDPIDFSDHYDTNSKPRYLKNATYHYHSQLGGGSCLEIYGTQVCGSNAAEKIDVLAPIAAAHQESMDNMPVKIVDFFADDNLDESKKTALRTAWANRNYDLLGFLRDYAASTAFHSETTHKYWAPYVRNIAIHNLNTLSSEEAYARKVYESPVNRMAQQGFTAFEPAHNVFGLTTGLQAANNRFIFKSAYVANATSPGFLYKNTATYSVDDDPANNVTWNKNWGSVVPANANGKYVVGEVAAWLWQRFIADGGKNFDPIARAQVQSLLYNGRDFGYNVDSSNPEQVYSSADISVGQAKSVNDAIAAAEIDLSSSKANINVGMAVNFITMTPYMFALEGK